MLEDLAQGGGEGGDTGSLLTVKGSCEARVRGMQGKHSLSMSESREHILKRDRRPATTACTVNKVDGNGCNRTTISGCRTNFPTSLSAFFYNKYRSFSTDFLKCGTSSTELESWKIK